MTRDETMDRITKSWNAWTAALDGIPEELAIESGVCGYYSIKDLAGHIAFWDERDLERAQRIAQGKEVQTNDWATMNDQEYEHRKDQSLEAQTSWMREAHAQLCAGLASLDQLDERMLLSETWEHYDDHRAQVLEWRTAKGIPA